MKCYICGNKIMADEDIVRITYGRFEGNYNCAEGIFNSRHTEYICKDCANAFNRIIGDINE